MTSNMGSQFKVWYTVVVVILVLELGEVSGLDVQEYVKYYLYTNENPKTPQEITFNDQNSLQNSNYNKSRPLRVTIHGYINDYLTGKVNNFSRDAYLSTGDYNIIAVDWSPLSHLDYATSATMTRFVGQAVADFLKWLVSVGYLTNFDNVHLIGHSLGAHVSGFCGKSLNGSLPVIHGLDPAGPLFWVADADDRLAITDAKYVQCIHTNAGGYGIYKALGHVDFFPNYGTTQPGCGIEPICAHEIVPNYFAEAITSPSGFYAKQCSSTNQILMTDYCVETGVHTFMGSYVQGPQFYGSYYLPVNDKAPYGSGTF